jgi:hypothetical protein
MRRIIENIIIGVLVIVMIAMVTVLVHNIWVYGWMY